MTKESKTTKHIVHEWTKYDNKYDYWMSIDTKPLQDVHLVLQTEKKNEPFCAFWF